MIAVNNVTAGSRNRIHLDLLALRPNHQRPPVTIAIATKAIRPKPGQVFPIDENVCSPPARGLPARITGASVANCAGCQTAPSSETSQDRSVCTSRPNPATLSHNAGGPPLWTSTEMLLDPSFKKGPIS